MRISENLVDYCQGNWGRVREFHGLKLLINLTKYLARSLENSSKLSDCNYVPVSNLLMQLQVFLVTLWELGACLYVKT